MKKTRFILMFAILGFASAGFADYQIVWHTIDGGGGQSSGGQYVLTGTIGQADAAYSQGGNYEVLGGFWGGGPICTVDFEQFATFAQYWLHTACSSSNNWCGGADLNKSTAVDMIDVDLFVQQWLYSCPYRWPLR
jgi:hypothetical protein